MALHHETTSALLRRIRHDYTGLIADDFLPLGPRDIGGISACMEYGPCPAFALVDLYADPKAWHPDPDDLDVPADQVSELVSACERLRVRLPASSSSAIGLGAFTGASGLKRGMFEIAHRGTLFLDEVGDLSLAAQAKILRVLQSGEILESHRKPAFVVTSPFQRKSGHDVFDFLEVRCTER